MTKEWDRRPPFGHWELVIGHLLAIGAWPLRFERPVSHPTLSCSECHSPIPADSGTLGLCPRCLMSRAMGGGGDGSEGPHEEAAGAPDVAELQGELPDLEMIGLLGHGGMGSVYSARQ